MKRHPISRLRTAVAMSICVIAFVGACSGNADPPSDPAVGGTGAGPLSQGAPPLASATGPQLGPGEVALVIGEDSKARYLVREQLARISFPSDAVGETDGVEGVIVFDANGVVQQDRSRIIVNLAGLRSDRSLRDNYLRGNTLLTNTFPDAEFVVKSIPGLPWPLPTSGAAELQLIGDMTIRGLTKELTWDVEAEFSDGGASGRANTSFTFGYFDI